MSYILDALKKVERDRRRAHVPSLATMHAVPVERRAIWPWIAGGALALNALGFAVVLVLRPSATPAVAPPAAVVTPPAPVAPKPVAATAEAPAPAATAPAVVAPQAVTVAPESTRTDAAPVERPRESSRRTDAARAVPARSPDAPARAAAARLAERREPDPFKLEVLVYSEQPAFRAAYINGTRYVEGQRVDGRALLESITSDSVVLVADGKRIILKQQ